MPSCGDGNLDLDNNEECDDGGNVPGDGCGANCQFEPVGQTCGNGTGETGEACDDNNLINGDACNPTCNSTNTTTLFTGTPGTSGNTDGAAAVALFGNSGVLASNDTHLFIGESTRIVRQIDIATAITTTIAGDGAQRHRDRGTGLTSSFGSIESITTDGTTLWVGDGFNKVIRAVDLTPPHAVTTVAGQVGVTAYADGAAGTNTTPGVRALTYFNSYVYFLDPNAATLRRFDPVSGDVVTLAGTSGLTGTTDGIGAAARFISPRYLTSDGSGMLFIADTNGNKIRTFNTVTTEVRTFAGDGTCGYTDGVGTAAIVQRPRGLTSDGTSIYWVEFNAYTIRQGVIATQSVSTMIGTPIACAVTCSCGSNPPAGGYAEGVGSAAVLDHPFSIAYHFPSRSLFFVDSGNSVIRRIR